MNRDHADELAYVMLALSAIILILTTFILVAVAVKVAA